MPLLLTAVVILDNSIQTPIYSICRISAKTSVQCTQMINRYCIVVYRCTYVQMCRCTDIQVYWVTEISGWHPGWDTGIVVWLYLPVPGGHSHRVVALLILPLSMNKICPTNYNSYFVLYSMQALCFRIRLFFFQQLGLLYLCHPTYRPVVNGRNSHWLQWEAQWCHARIPALRWHVQSWVEIPSRQVMRK